MNKERLHTLVLNLVGVLEREIFTSRASTDDKIDFLIDEIGITEDEIEELNIVDECF